MKHRNIETKIWDDMWFSDLDPIEKLLFIYLFTNSRATLCGIYELPLKIMSVETGIEKEMLIKIIKRFESDGKVIHYNGYMALKNSEKYQSSSPTIKIAIENERILIPKAILEKIDTLWIGYGYGRVAVPKSRVEESRVEESIEENTNEVAVAPVSSYKKFQKPKIEEVKAYCDERSNGIDPQAFIDYYESNGWKVGKNSMKDWKASVRTWERNGYSKNKTSTTTTTNLDDPNVMEELNKKYK